MKLYFEKDLCKRCPQRPGGGFLQRRYVDAG